MEYCALGGEILVVVQNAKMQEPIACAVFGGLGGALVAWVCVLCAWVGGSVETLESRCVGACRGLVVLGRWWGLHKFCKIYAKIANFCATICADRFRSCYLKLCQIVPKSSRAV